MPTGDHCKQTGCKRPIFKEKQCKHHYSNLIKAVLRKEIRNLFRGPEKVFLLQILISHRRIQRSTLQVEASLTKRTSSILALWTISSIASKTWWSSLDKIIYSLRGTAQGVMRTKTAWILTFLRRLFSRIYTSSRMNLRAKKTGRRRTIRESSGTTRRSNLSWLWKDWRS